MIHPPGKIFHPADKREAWLRHVEAQGNRIFALRNHHPKAPEARPRPPLPVGKPRDIGAVPIGAHL
jgi:hypothetical protein